MNTNKLAWTRTESDTRLSTALESQPQTDQRRSVCGVVSRPLGAGSLGFQECASQSTAKALHAEFGDIVEMSRASKGTRRPSGAGAAAPLRTDFAENESSAPEAVPPPPSAENLQKVTTTRKCSGHCRCRCRCRYRCLLCDGETVETMSREHGGIRIQLYFTSDN